jgi:hypothetical protein
MRHGMYDPRCVRCRSARSAGYDGCTIHNTARRRYSVPTVVVVDNYTPAAGVDITDGDPVIALGGGLGIDPFNGDLEVQVAPGVYVDVDPSPDFGGSDW